MTAPKRYDLEALELLRAGRLREAEHKAREAVEGARVCLPAHGLLASILFRQGDFAAAEHAVITALGLAAGGGDAYDGLAFVSMQMGRHERANALYRRAVERAPADPRLWYNFAASERMFGRLDEAAAACTRAIALDATQYPSYLLRSELRVQTTEANHIAELERQLGATRDDDRAQMFLGYAVAKELDDVGRHDDAFRWFAHAAATRRRHLAYDVAIDERKLEQIARAFPGSPPLRRDAATGSGRFVFIIGLPRSGTTLLERILTGLPGVVSNGETENFSRALLSAAPPGGADVFERAAAADPALVAGHYARLAGHPGAARVIEKMPLNYLYAGAIRRALPDARLILVSRAPLDSCFAMYRTLFGAAYPFSYSFEELARYYAAYHRLMDHWRRTLGAGLYEVNYEDLVRTPAEVAARIAAYCDVEWTDRAIHIQNNSAVSLTASAAQVRRPIYGSSSGRWRHYRRHLTALIAALRAGGVDVPQDSPAVIEPRP
jgi:Flp pilus assembly protein TadD